MRSSFRTLRGGQPIGIDVAPNGREVWVSNYESNTITVIDTATDRIAHTFPERSNGPARIKFTPDGKYVWVTNSRSNELIVFNLTLRRVIRRIQTGKFSKGRLVLPDARHALVSAMEDTRVVEVDVPTGRVLQTMSKGKAPEAWPGLVRDNLSVAFCNGNSHGDRGPTTPILPVLHELTQAGREMVNLPANPG